MNNQRISGNTYEMMISDIIIDCSFQFKDTAKLFGSYIIGPSNSENCIQVPSLDWEYWLKDGGRKNAQAEFTCFTGCASDALLPHNHLILHGVSFSHRNKAWLICASSGVGKSTQIKTLKELYPSEFEVICGDRTVLQLADNGCVIAHPSPWNGKERWYGTDPAQLAGILCLERGETTDIIRLEPNEAVIPVFQSIISTFSSEGIIHQIAAFEIELLKRVPVWRFINGGIPDSSRILYEQIINKME